MNSNTGSKATALTMKHFSLAIIGSGSGHALVPEDPAQGAVAVIEADAFGGTCINRGCVPSKIMVHTADVAVEIRDASRFGIGTKVTGVDWRAIRDRTFSRVEQISADGRSARASCRSTHGKGTEQASEPSTRRSGWRLHLGRDRR